MPRPKNKQELIAAAQQEHDKLDTLIETVPPSQLEYASSTIEEWGVKDVLAHLYEWEQMCLGWYRAGLAGENPHLPAEGYNWRQIPALNEQIYQNYRTRPLDEVLQKYRDSYKEIFEIIQSIDEDEMFTPSRYSWTRKNAMGTYFVSATSSHYVWATKEIKKILRKQELKI